MGMLLRDPVHLHPEHRRQVCTNLLYELRSHVRSGPIFAVMKRYTRKCVAFQPQEYNEDTLRKSC